MYTSCEPCPMCMGAIYWARPEKVYYANSREDAARIGFDDSFIYSELSRDLSDRKIQIINLGADEALQIFNEWTSKNDKLKY